MSNRVPAPNEITLKDLPPDLVTRARLFASLFKNDDNSPRVMPDGQLTLFTCLIFRLYPRLAVNCCTQYGKSETIAMAAIILSNIFEEILCITGPTGEKANIIMDYYLQHLSDHKLFISNFGGTKDAITRMQTQEAKDSIILRNGGGIFTVSLQSTSFAKSLNAAMGFGAKIILNDENAQVEDATEATTFRMIAGKTGRIMYVKISNPSRRGQFFNSWYDPNYTQIFIDYEQALAEGRYNHGFIEEARRKPLFPMLYACLFPDEDEVDSRGYYRLFSTDQRIKLEVHKDILPEDVKWIGCDIGAGGDPSAFTARAETAKHAVKLNENTVSDITHQLTLIRGWHVTYPNATFFIDDTGIGEMLSDVVEGEGIPVVRVKVGSSAMEKDKYRDVKAENSLLLKEWAAEGTLEPDEGWKEIDVIKFKENVSSKLQLEPKDELRKQGVRSPNVFDSLMLTFTQVQDTPEFGMPVFLGVS